MITDPNKYTSDLKKNLRDIEANDGTALPALLRIDDANNAFYNYYMQVIRERVNIYIYINIKPPVESQLMVMTVLLMLISYTANKIYNQKIFLLLLELQGAY